MQPDVILSSAQQFLSTGPTVRSMWGLSGGGMVLGKLPVPWRPTGLDNIGARAYCACSRCEWGLFGHFFSLLPFLFSISLAGRRPNID